MAASEGIINGSFIVFTLMFLGSMVFGRVFCGWLCPAGGLQRFCMRINNKQFKVGRRDWIKYLVWTPWMSLVIYMLVIAGGIRSINPFYQTYYGISVQDLGSLILFLLILGTIGIVSICSSRRGFCHYLCWMAPFMIIGRRIRNTGKWISLKLLADKSKCIECMSCSRNCPMSLYVNKMVREGNMENSECILCGTCIDVCPTNTISFSYSSG
jgi:polyferredoxin